MIGDLNSLSYKELLKLATLDPPLDVQFDFNNPLNWNRVCYAKMAVTVICSALCIFQGGVALYKSKISKLVI